MEALLVFLPSCRTILQGEGHCNLQNSIMLLPTSLMPCLLPFLNGKNLPNAKTVFKKNH